MKKLLLLFFVLPMVCFGQIPESKPNTYVNDYIGVLTDAQIQELNDSILSIEKKSPTQIAILLMKEIPNGVEAAEYANNVGRQWKVGKDKSGIVYVAGVDQHKQGIGTALNIEASITDYECSRIMDEMKPYFREKDYYGGLKHMVAEINLLIDPTSAPASSSNTWIFVVIISGVIGIVIYLIVRRNKKKEDVDNYMPSMSSGYGGNLASFATGYVAGSSSGYSGGSSYSGSSSGSDSGGSSSSSSSSSYGDYSGGSSGGDSGFSGGGASSDW